ncbi:MULTISPECIES: ATP/GTP-binding protein [unclassified Imperialibacter]|uniref:AAA family ATPase n=1 Tax=unclassified Imperialibacter TaxID=2629706 RepID=UPI001251227F|nr:MULTISPECIES: ATP-binding protein [unclassified Imperialibacter]CAD5271350.1 conserved hypothetical protein [Imperialibacter sp. 75]CAD5298411.1 conserved hypothetical protein [Imperialibacter sp. 89]VVT35620.1 conserved hypothetical protein [Imperialibacter sp. EC-SDR9]
MAGENHLTYFKVENFKRFKELEVKDIGQFNLVLGDNNVGKTSFLEALLFESWYSDWSFLNFKWALIQKNADASYKGDVMYAYLNREQVGKYSEELIKYRFEFASGDFDDRKGKDFQINVSGGGFVVEPPITSPLLQYESDASKRLELSPDFKAPLIPFSLAYKDDLVYQYSKDIQEDKYSKNALINGLKIIVPSINDIEVSLKQKDSPSLLIKRSDYRFSMPLVSFGDGVNKLFRILCDIIWFRGKRLMIDEIDTGIHYSRMKDFWETILLAAKENDVQLFASTHNLECIKYFKEALEELSDLQDKARTITLVEHLQTKDILAHTNHFDVLESELALGNEVR